MKCKFITKLLFFIAFFLITHRLISQTDKHEKMELLSFMVGEWIGTSKIYENGVITKQAAAFQKISYDLDSSIIVVELNSEWLQLHTIIFYDEKDSKYYYYPFSSGGVSRLPAEYINGQLIVKASDKTRFVFSSYMNGGFQEYGERLVGGKWIKYFEDTFSNSK